MIFQTLVFKVMNIIIVTCCIPAQFPRILGEAKGSGVKAVETIIVHNLTCW